MNSKIQICKECKHTLEIHSTQGKVPCGELIFTKPTKEEQHYMPEFGGTYDLCECKGYNDET